MWKYQNTDELYHTGVLGMKWGHRKALTVSDIKKNSDATRQNVVSSKKQFKKDRSEYKKYKKKRLSAKNILKKDSSYKNMVNSSSKYINDYKKFKEANSNRNKALEKAKNDVKSTQNLFERSIIDPHGKIRRKAAQYVVDNNMSIKDAKKKATKNAVLYTSAVLGSIGAMELYDLYKKK